MLQSGEVLVFMTGDKEERYRISSVDGRIVKLLGEDGSYKQMPYSGIMELIEEGYVKVERNPLFEDYE